MEYAEFDFTKAEHCTQHQDLGMGQMQYVESIAPAFEPIPWQYIPEIAADDMNQFISWQSERSYSESDSGASSRSQSQHVFGARNSTSPHMDSRKERRLEQNRAAQRAFRERKEKALVELQHTIALLKEEASELISDNERLQKNLDEAEKTIEVLKSVVPATDVPSLKIIPERSATSSPSNLSPRSFVVKIDVSGLACDCGATRTEPTLSVAKVECHQSASAIEQHIH